MKVVFIGTVISSFYRFRADLIRTLLKKGRQVYAFTSEYTTEDLKNRKVSCYTNYIYIKPWWAKSTCRYDCNISTLKKS